MKTTLVLLIAALFLLTTPLLAAAHDGDRHDGGAKQYKGWVKDRHDSDHYRHDREHKWERKAKKHYKKHLREHRRDHRKARRHIVRHNRWEHKRPHYSRPAVVYGYPRIVFHLDW